ncbi:hypothetical protein, partial [Xanthomonas campestris]|uniref:hypothetical protein n=1 Tax=Xanthomonas campestris TaxID=339 RepID=UPI002AD3A5F5
WIQANFSTNAFRLATQAPDINPQHYPQSRSIRLCTAQSRKKIMQMLPGVATGLGGRSMEEPAIRPRK